MNEPEQTIMRTSLSRPQQLLGGDREMVIMAGLGAAMMAVSVMTFLSFLLAIVGFWIDCHCPGEDRQGRSDDAEGLQPSPAIQGFLPRQKRGHWLWQDAKAGLEVGVFGETRKQPTGLADLLLWFGLVDDGIVLQRDGSLLAAWQYRGPDLQSATHAEMAAIARRLNRILRLGSGWMIQVDSFRSFSSGYSPKAFPDAVTALIDRERREQFALEGSHFENEYFLALTYMPPLVASEKLTGFMMSGSDSTHSEGANAGAEALRFFKAKIRQFEDVFAAQFPVSRLKAAVTNLGDGYERVDDELLAYLRRCLTGRERPGHAAGDSGFSERSALDGGSPRWDRTNDGRPSPSHVVGRCLPALDLSRRSFGAGHRALRVPLEHARDPDGPVGGAGNHR
jgi:hypothetical protein